MDAFLRAILTIAIGYLVGNFSTGIVVSKLQANTDIREHGSGNTGATNMLRVLGGRPALWTLVGDILKGAIACLVGFALLGRTGGILGGAAAIVGHDFPVFFNFKGGKGVATTFGALLFLFPWQMLVVAGVFVVVVAISRMVSLGSICAAIVMPFLIAFTMPKGSWLDTVLVFLMAALCVFSHRENIKRILAGKESKLDFAQFRKKITKPKKD